MSSHFAYFQTIKILTKINFTKKNKEKSYAYPFTLSNKLLSSFSTLGSLISNSMTFILWYLILSIRFNLFLNRHLISLFFEPYLYLMKAIFFKSRNRHHLHLQNNHLRHHHLHLPCSHYILFRILKDFLVIPQKILLRNY